MKIIDGLRIGIMIAISLGVVLGCQSSPTPENKPAEEVKKQEQPVAKAGNEQDGKGGNQIEDQEGEGGNLEDQDGENPVDDQEGEEKPAEDQEGKEENSAEEKKPEENLAMDEEAKAKERLRKRSERDVELRRQQGFYMEHLLKTAKIKIDSYQYKDAKSFLDQALEIDPTNKKAQEMRNLVGSMLGEKNSQGQTWQEIYNAEIQVRQEQTKLEVQNHYRNGLNSLEKKNYDQAIRQFERVLEIIEINPYPLGLDSLKKQTEAQIAKVKELKEQWAVEQGRQKMEEARKMAESVEEEERARLESKIRMLLTQATDFYTHKKYDNAQMMVEQVLQIDPSNKIADKLLDDIKEARHSYLSDRTLERRIEGWKRFLEDMRESSVPYSDLLYYPERDYWENVIKKREEKGGILGVSKKAEIAQKSKAIKEIENQLKERRVSWDFSETPFQEVITVIRFQDKINIVVDPQVIQNFELEGIKVTLKLEDVSLQNALNILLELYKLTYVFRNDVLFITTKDSMLAKKKVFLALHDIRDLTGQIKDFPGPSIELAESEGEEGTGTGALFVEEEEEKTALLTGEKLIELIKASIAPGTWESESGQYSIAEMSGQLVVVHEEEIHKEIHYFLKDLRSFSGLLVSIESRFLEVTDDFLEKVGVDWRGIGDENFTTTPARSRAIMPAVSPGLEDLSSTDATADNNSASFSPAAGAFYAYNQLNRGGNGRDPYNRIDARARTEHVDEQQLGDRLQDLGGLALQIATLDDMQLNAVLYMVKKTGRGEVVTAPRLTTFNTQRANITVVEQRAYVKDYDVEVAQSAYIADPVIGTVQTGVVLDVRPIISNDKKYITLELRPTVASLVGGIIGERETSLGASGRTVKIGIPEIRLQSVETTVRIPDQGSIMLGGLKSYREIDRKLDIPVLGNIPVVSFFFSQRTKVEEKQNLIILVTGKIIDLEHEEKKVFGVGK